MLFGAALQGLSIFTGLDNKLYTHCLWVQLTMRCICQSVADRYMITESSVMTFPAARARQAQSGGSAAQQVALMGMFDQKHQGVLRSRANRKSGEAMILMTSDRPAMTQIISATVDRTLLRRGRLEEVSDWKERLILFSQTGHAPADMYSLAYPPALMIPYVMAGQAVNA